MGSRSNFLAGLFSGLFATFLLHNVFLVQRQYVVSSEERKSQPEVIREVDCGKPPEPKLKPEEAGWFPPAMAALQRERLATLRGACADHQRATTIPNKGNLYSRRYKFSICEINKCGSTSWLQAVLLADGFFTEDDWRNHRIRGEAVIRLARTNASVGSLGDKDTMREHWIKATRIITVRNPFERLVSAFNDKMVPDSPGFTSYFGPLSKKILLRYRAFRRGREGRVARNEESATFEDFLNALADPKFGPVDSHWKSYNQLCVPCYYDYNYIVKMETLREDTHYLKTLLNVTEEDKKLIFPIWRTRTKDDLVERFFENIPKTLALKVYEIYKKDFEMFGYPKPAWL